MNYLAHAYLSFNEPEVLVGNIISDFVKGNKKFDYSPGIQKGIVLHRAIDTFTDDHAATKAARLFFKPIYRLYSGAFVVVVYDHFLANDSNEFIFNGSLENFSKNVYQILEDNSRRLPEEFKYLFSFMKTQNWLSNYQYMWGIEKGFRGLVNRAAYINESDIAFSIFNEHYDELKKCYNEFFPQQKEFAARQLRNL
jgi:acyl carrier protein phosphodiesterase